MFQAEIMIERRRYLRLPDSSVSNIIPNLIPTESWVPYRAFWNLAKGITNSEGHALVLREIAEKSRYQEEYNNHN